MAFNIDFDIERSLKESPPDYPKGVNFKKRIVANRNNLIRNFQPRNLELQISNVAPIRNSYEINGVLYNQPVKAGEANDKDKRKINLLSGYTRDAAEEELGWGATMIDILEFDTPRIRREFMYTSNIVQNPRTGNTNADIAKGVADGIEAGEIKNDDVDILAFLDVVAADKTEKQKESITKLARKLKSPYANMKPYDGPRANAKLKELGLQYAGMSSKEAEGIAYARPTGYSKGVFWDSLELAKKYGGTTFAPVVIYGYIENPKPSQLKADRKAWLKDFKRMEEKMIDVISFGMDMSIGDVRKDLKCPFVFGGFLPQDTTPNSSGKIKETGIVDEYGNPFIGN